MIKRFSFQKLMISKEKCNKLSIIGCIFPRSPTGKIPLCGHALNHNAWPYWGIFPVGDRGEMQWIIDTLLHFLFSFFYLWGLPPTLASLRTVMIQWQSIDLVNCEAPGSKPCQFSYISALFWGITSHFRQLWLKVMDVGPLFGKHIWIHMLLTVTQKQTLANYYSITSQNVYYYLVFLWITHCQNHSINWGKKITPSLWQQCI